MITVNLLKQRLLAIADNLKQHPNGLGLLGLGSAGKEMDRMDNYSDLDFFAIVQSGYKQQFIDNLHWLSSLNPIAFCFRNTADGYKLMFEDGVFCEFAVFEPQELEQIPYAEGAFIWRDEQLPERLKAPLRMAPEQSDNKEYLLGELLTNLYVGLGRFLRGEHNSAMRFIQIYAVDRLIALLDLDFNPGTEAYIDDFCCDRRVEQRHPKYQALLASCTQGSERCAQSAQSMIEFISLHYQTNSKLVAEINRLIKQAL